MDAWLTIRGGHRVQVDSDLLPLLGRWTWQLSPEGYVQRNVRRGPRFSTVLMHEHVIDAPQGASVAYRDGNKLNLTRQNLEPVSRAQVNRRRKKQEAHSGHATTSRYKGVRLKRDGAWEANIRLGGKGKYLGRFQNEERAAHAYDEAAREHFGSDACVNFPLAEERPAT